MSRTICRSKFQWLDWCPNLSIRSLAWSQDMDSLSLSFFIEFIVILIHLFGNYQTSNYLVINSQFTITQQLLLQLTILYYCSLFCKSFGTPTLTFGSLCQDKRNIEVLMQHIFKSLDIISITFFPVVFGSILSLWVMGRPASGSYHPGSISSVLTPKEWVSGWTSHCLVTPTISSALTWAHLIGRL